jgi:hypothetical protein
MVGPTMGKASRSVGAALLHALPGLVFAQACTSAALPPIVPVAAQALAIDASTVEIQFTASVDPASVDSSAMSIIAPLVRPIETLDVLSASAEGATLSVKTASQSGGRWYALRLGALRFVGADAVDAPSQVDFAGFGTTPILLLLDARGYSVTATPTALVTADPDSGAFTEQLHPFALAASSAEPAVFTATIAVRTSPGQQYAARAVLPDDSPAASLAVFTASTARRQLVALSCVLPKLPEFLPPVDPNPGDGFAPVRVVFDDRPARALEHPALKSSLTADGHFDLSTSRVDPLNPVPGKPHVYDAVLSVAVDPARRLDGTRPSNFPYVAYLVESGMDVETRSTSFIMPTETPQVVVVLVGNPALVPVTYRVDISQSILRPDRSLRGKYPGEGIFLTGEFLDAEDALGRLAADSFSGGERATLEMDERPDAPGIYTKTVFLPPDRPYGWKLVRCPTGVGCAELNRHVTSSGRAFPTVMKNLVSQNADAQGNSAVAVIDPAHLDQVASGGMTLNYSAAVVSTTGMEAPSPAVMFKQEAPDLVVSVAKDPVTTPIIVVGTWRDVNLPVTPAQILTMNLTVALGPYDYDSGLIGHEPPHRDLMLPVDPPPPMPGVPAFVATDGLLDAPAEAFDAGPGRLPLWVGWNARDLYVATSTVEPGHDHFVLISFDAPSTVVPAAWNKAGTQASGRLTYFLVAKGDGMGFVGWFQHGTTGSDDLAMTSAAFTHGSGAVLEGAIDSSQVPGLSAALAQGSVWVAALSYVTGDRSALLPDAQNPPGNADGNLDAAEWRQLSLANLRAP